MADHEDFDPVAGEASLETALGKLRGSVDHLEDIIRIETAEDLRTLMTKSSEFFIQNYRNLILSPAQTDLASAHLAHALTANEAEYNRLSREIKAALQARAMRFGETVASLVGLFGADIDLSRRDDSTKSDALEL